MQEDVDEQDLMSAAGQDPLSLSKPEALAEISLFDTDMRGCLDRYLYWAKWHGRKHSNVPLSILRRAIRFVYEEYGRPQ